MQVVRRLIIISPLFGNGCVSVKTLLSTRNCVNYQNYGSFSGIQSKRFLSTCKQLLYNSNKLTTTNEVPYRPRGRSKLPEFNPKFMGVATDIFIPASRKNLPSVLSQPTVVFKTLIRRMYMLGLNTFKIGLYRSRSGKKPAFLLWKNKAIENYIEVHKAFAERRIDKVKNHVSVWVERALLLRSESIPKNIRLDWRIVKFNGVPKLMSLDPIMVPGMPLEYIQLVYKFSTKQELIKINSETNESGKQVKDIVDYLVFLCDTNTNEMILSGSIFESKPGAPLPRQVTSNEKKEILERMKECGDIFRLPLQKKE